MSMTQEEIEALINGADDSNKTEEVTKKETDEYKDDFIIKLDKDIEEQKRKVENSQNRIAKSKAKKPGTKLLGNQKAKLDKLLSDKKEYLEKISKSNKSNNTKNSNILENTDNIDLSDIITGQISYTLEALLSVDTKILSIEKYSNSQLPDTNIATTASLCMGEYSSDINLIIGKSLAVECEYLMLGGIADKKKNIDDEVTDVVTEILNTAYKFITDKINLERYNNFNNVSVNSFRRNGKDEKIEKNIFKLNITLKGEKYSIFIAFEDNFLHFIDKINKDYNSTIRFLSEYLSQEEIYNLSDIAEEDIEKLEEESYKYKAKNKPYSIYDFRKPNLISLDQMKAFNYIHDKMIRGLAFDIKKDCGINKGQSSLRLYSIEQMTYGEFTISIPNITYLNVLNSQKLDKSQAIIEISPGIRLKILENKVDTDEMKVTTDLQKEITKLELKEMNDFTKNTLIKNINSAWNNVFSFDYFSSTSETNVNSIDITANHEIVLLVVYELIIGDESGFIIICYPINYIKNALDIIVDKVFPSEKIDDVDLAVLDQSKKLKFKKAKHGVIQYKHLKDGENIKYFLHKTTEKDYEIQEPIVGENAQITRDIIIGEKLILNDGRRLEQYEVLDQMNNEPVNIYANGEKVQNGEVIIIDSKYGYKLKDKIYDIGDTYVDVSIVKYRENKFKQTLILQGNLILFRVDDFDGTIRKVRPELLSIGDNKQKSYKKLKLKLDSNIVPIDTHLEDSEGDVFAGKSKAGSNAILHISGQKSLEDQSVIIVDGQIAAKTNIKTKEEEKKEN